MPKNNIGSASQDGSNRELPNTLDTGKSTWEQVAWLAEHWVSTVRSIHPKRFAAPLYQDELEEEYNYDQPNRSEQALDRDGRPITSTLGIPQYLLDG